MCTIIKSGNKNFNRIIETGWTSFQLSYNSLNASTKVTQRQMLVPNPGVMCNYSLPLINLLLDVIVYVIYMLSSYCYFLPNVIKFTEICIIFNTKILLLILNVIEMFLYIPSKHFWVLQTFDRKRLAKVNK